MSESNHSSEDKAETASQSTERHPLSADLLKSIDTQPALFEKPDEQYLIEKFFPHEPFDQGRELEGYWVNEPFAYISVRFDEQTRDHRYVIIEPELQSAERIVRKDLERIIRNVWRDRTVVDMVGEDGQITETSIRSVIEEQAATVDPGVKLKLFYYLTRDFAGYGPIDPIMHDRAVEDISCDGHDTPVFVYHQAHRDLETNLHFEEAWLDRFVVRLAQRAGDFLTVADPRAGGMLPDGSRIQLTLGGEISARGSNFTIRKFRDIPFTPVELIESNTFSIDQMAFLWLAIENNMSIIFVGPTASGKTTSMNAVSLFLPPNRKVVSVEQIRELSIPHENWIASVTRETTTANGRSEIGMYHLLQDALHQRPEYLLVGEIRTEPEVVRTFFHSTFTGHPGGTTFHAKDSKSAIERLLSEPLSVPERMINAIDIISVQRQVILDERRLRRNFEIVEVNMPESELEIVPLFEWDPYTDSFDHADDLYGESRVLRDIAENRGWDELQINEELYRRRSMLQFLITHGYTDYEEVINTLYLFARDRDYLIEEIREGRFDPTTVEDL